MNVNAVDSIIRYALVVAASNDDWSNRDLGPIHLIKYVYLADLAHAEGHAGETYTGARWRFYHYGPWAPEVFQRVEPAAVGVGADVERISSSQFDQDFIRYRLAREEAELRAREIEGELPTELRLRIRRAVRDFGKDTQSLLDFVYRTRPMLRAAPGEDLDFYAVTVGAGPYPDGVAEPQPEGASLSRKAEKRRSVAVEELRGRIRARLRERLSQRRQPPVPAPRYDEVFAEGQRQLDEIAGNPVPDGELEGRFADDIWHSRGRAETELP